MPPALAQVLVKSSIPIFFLFAQLSIAVVLLCVSHVFGIFVIPKCVPSRFARVLSSAAAAPR